MGLVPETESRSLCPEQPSGHSSQPWATCSGREQCPSGPGRGWPAPGESGSGKNKLAVALGSQPATSMSPEACPQKPRGLCVRSLYGHGPHTGQHPTGTSRSGAWDMSCQGTPLPSFPVKESSAGRREIVRQDDPQRHGDRRQETGPGPQWQPAGGSPRRRGWVQPAPSSGH